MINVERLATGAPPWDIGGIEEKANLTFETDPIDREAQLAPPLAPHLDPCSMHRIPSLTYWVS